MLEIHNKIQDIEKHIAKLKQSLIRNKNGYFKDYIVMFNIVFRLIQNLNK